MKAIQTEQLTKFYGSSRGIIDVNLAIEAGDFFGFIGPNGAGKSTLIRTLLGLLSPTSGRAEIFGKDIVRDKIEILANVGYLPSEAAFYNGMRVRDILALSAKLRDLDCTEEANRLCERLDLDPTRKINTLSLGNKKKVGIVCALQHKPDLYILDEPTGGLDPLIQKEFYSILKERNNEGATVFLSSHVLSEISLYCKHAAIIREGKILISDSVEKLGHMGVKRVSITGVDALPAINGVRDLTAENGTLRFLYSGDPAALLATLSALSLTDVNISDPTLDEIFLHYYGKENA